MKSMVLTGIRQMEMIEVPDPKIVHDTDVLIKMDRVGVCGSDIHYLQLEKLEARLLNTHFPLVMRALELLLRLEVL